jgi:hypothetical protein
MGEAEGDQWFLVPWARFPDRAYLSDGQSPSNLIKLLQDSTLNRLLIQMMSTDANDLIVA